jgi:hypothetical protein
MKDDGRAAHRLFVTGCVIIGVIILSFILAVRGLVAHDHGALTWGAVAGTLGGAVALMLVTFKMLKPLR